MERLSVVECKLNRIKFNESAQSTCEELCLVGIFDIIDRSIKDINGRFTENIDH